MDIKKTIKYLISGVVLLACGYTASMVHYSKNFVMIERTTAENVEKYNQKRVEDAEDILLQDRYVLIDKTEIGHFSTLFEAFNEIKGGYIDELDTKELVDGAITGMTTATGDRHTVYTPIKTGEETVETKLGKTYKGIGAEVTALDGHIVITNPYKGAPAYNAGIRSYDRITEVDGTKVRGMNLAEVTGKIKGEKGTNVTITIEREGTGTFDVTVMRDEIKTESVLHEIIQRGDKKVGVIEIMSFGESTTKDFKNALKELEKDGIASLIVDVRDNGGGYLGAVKDIASEMLPKGETIVKLKGREGKEEESKSNNVSAIKKSYPIVVLVNENSASASEVLAAAMKETGDYPIVGKKTFGKGTVQELVELEDGSEIRITVSKWLTPEGEWIHEQGINPSIEVERSEIKQISSVRLADEIEGIGSVSDSIKNAQVVLAALGYSLEQRNGYFDGQTSKAIVEFQNSKGIEETGFLDEPTVLGLNSALLHLREDKESDEQLNQAIEISLK